MKIKVEKNQVRLFVINPVYETKHIALKDPEGHFIKDELGHNLKVEGKKFIKEAFLKVWFHKENLKAYGEYLGSKGQIVKNRTQVFNELTQTYYTVAHSIGEMEEVMQPHKHIASVGYKNLSDAV